MVPLRSGGGMGIRTPDLLIANETLYQLSYTPKTSDPQGLTDISESQRMLLSISPVNSMVFLA
jgi:hypothetical protein